MEAIDVSIIVAVIAAVNGISVAIISGMFSRTNKSNEEYRAKREKQEERREERDAAMYDLVFASTNGTEVLLEAAHGDDLNGNVETALSSIRNAKSQCNHIANQSMAKM